MTERILSGYRIVEILHGDTLQVIAARELDDAGRWVDIAEINGLHYPYLTGSLAEASDKVKMYGESLLVPAAATTVSAVTDPDRVYGVDLLLTTDGELLAEDGDFVLVAGRANLKQALTHRIVTDLRELLFHLPYGCDVRRVVGTVNGPAAGLLAAQYVKSALILDPRIASVVSCTANIIADRIEVRATVQPITGSTVDIAVEL